MTDFSSLFLFLSGANEVDLCNSKFLSHQRSNQVSISVVSNDEVWFAIHDFKDLISGILEMQRGVGDKSIEDE